jgi:hypothetical protein
MQAVKPSGIGRILAKLIALAERDLGFVHPAREDGRRPASSAVVSVQIGAASSTMAPRGAGPCVSARREPHLKID